MAQPPDPGRLARRPLGGVDATVIRAEVQCRRSLSGQPGGSLVSLVELRFNRPDLDGDEAAANLAELILRMLGVPPDDAREVSRRPLPGLVD